MRHFRNTRGRRIAATAAAAIAGVTAVGMGVGQASPPGYGGPSTATPIKHLVVIFQENVSFDHYFGTYPTAANPQGEPAFHAAPGTPTVNGLGTALLTDNPNLSDPQRLSRAEAATCDQDHGYTAEQSAFDHGLMDQFVQNTGHQETLQQCLTKEGNPAPATGADPDYATMDYYDGNTVTALWNYAQHYSMSDNSYGTTFGPSSPGAVNVTSGNTFGAICGPASAVVNAPACTGAAPGAGPATPGTVSPQGAGTMYSDADPYFDVCSSTEDQKTTAQTIQMGGRNVGDLLNAKNVSWGWFQGGFAGPDYQPGKPSTDDLSAVCTSRSSNVLGQPATDYNPHHEPFQYYASTANPQHLPPTSVAAIGHQDRANHQYDLKDFWAAADSDNLPSVSYLKAPSALDGHAGYSDPLSEQKYLVSTINHLQQLPSWKDTAVVINYDDSDGWYDHQMGPVLTQSQNALDTLSAPGQCGSNPAKVPSGQQARCGVGPRLPLLVVSPYSRANSVDSTLTSQTSIVKFIEDNWHTGTIGGGSADATSGALAGLFDFTQHGRGNSTLLLDPNTGEPLHGNGH